MNGREIKMKFDVFINVIEFISSIIIIYFIMNNSFRTEFQIMIWFCIFICAKSTVNLLSLMLKHYTQKEKKND